MRGSTHLLLGRLRGKHLVQLKGHLLPLVQEVQDGVVIRIECHRADRLRALSILLSDGADSPEDADVPLGGGAEAASAPPWCPAVPAARPRRTFQPHQLVVALLAELQLPAVLAQQLPVGAVHLLNGLSDLGEAQSSAARPHRAGRGAVG